MAGVLMTGVSGCRGIVGESLTPEVAARFAGAFASVVRERLDTVERLLEEKGTISRADIEGYPDVGGLFRDTSEAETGHAFGHLDFLKEVGDPATGVPIGNTEANLKSAIEGENRALRAPRRRQG